MTEEFQLTEDGGVITGHDERSKLSGRAITLALAANVILALLKRS